MESLSYNLLHDHPSPFDSSGSRYSATPGVSTPRLTAALTVDPGVLQTSPELSFDTLSLWESSHRKRALSVGPSMDAPEASKRRRPGTRPPEYSYRLSAEPSPSQRDLYFSGYDSVPQVPHHQTDPAYQQDTSRQLQMYGSSTPLQAPQPTAPIWTTPTLHSMGLTEGQYVKLPRPGMQDW